MTQTVRQGLLEAFRKLMKPLVRILIRNGVSHGELNEVLKGVFYEVAESNFEISGRQSSQSRVAILTGLSRKEVAKQKAILEAGTQFDQAGNFNRVMRVLEGWHTDSDFTGPYGMPIEIPFDARDGVSFFELVRRYSGDMGARAMLDELIRVGAVEISGSGGLKVLTRAYVPQTLHPDALEYFGRAVRNFVSTQEFNMQKSAPGTGRFDRNVFADSGLPVDLVASFDKVLREKGQQLLVELDNWLAAQEQAAGSSLAKVTRIKTGVGVYHFIEEED